MNKKKAESDYTNSIFTRKNYLITIIAVAVIALGFILMAGDSGETKYSFRRITLAPIVVLIGFGIGGYAIFHKDKEETKD